MADVTLTIPDELKDTFDRDAKETGSKEPTDQLVAFLNAKKALYAQLDASRFVAGFSLLPAPQQTSVTADIAAAVAKSKGQ